MAKLVPFSFHPFVVLKKALKCSIRLDFCFKCVQTVHSFIASFSIFFSSGKLNQQIKIFASAFGNLDMI